MLGVGKEGEKVSVPSLKKEKDNKKPCVQKRDRLEKKKKGKQIVWSSFFFVVQGRRGIRGGYLLTESTQINIS